MSIFTQRNWRAAGGSCLLLSMLMAFYGTYAVDLSRGWLPFLGYWSLFALLLMAAVYSALLDFRFTRLRYKAEERLMFQETFLSPGFRQELEEARRKQADAAQFDALDEKRKS